MPSPTLLFSAASFTFAGGLASLYRWTPTLADGSAPCVHLILTFPPVEAAERIESSGICIRIISPESQFPIGQENSCAFCTLSDGRPLASWTLPSHTVTFFSSFAISLSFNSILWNIPLHFDSSTLVILSIMVSGKGSTLNGL